MDQTFLRWCRPRVMAGLVVGAVVSSASGGTVDPAVSSGAITALESWLSRPRDERPALVTEGFAAAALTKEDATRAKTMLWEDHAALIRATRAEEMQAKRIELNGKTMRFDMRRFGTKPATGHSLFISMHGGGNAQPEVNDSQWANQLSLGEKYSPTEGVYLAPRAPTNTWNLWHEAHIDSFFDRLIENLVVLEGVNSDRVYLLGYSAGGDGVYQLAPRLADRFAAAAMMAGHPNEATPEGLRNIGFAVHVGALDARYRRNEVAREWGGLLAALRSADPGGYAHQVTLHEGKPHWMGLEDRVAIPWMEKFTRNPWPETVVWKQDDVVHDRLYWLAVDAAAAKAGDQIVARCSGSTLTVATNRPMAVTLLLDDALLDLDQSLTVITKDGRTVFQGHAPRTLGALHRSLLGRAQQPLMAPARIDLPVIEAVD